MEVTDKFVKKVVSELKNKSTIYEKLMICKLKTNRIKFIFQYPIKFEKTFIVCDFFLPKYNVIIELDGMYHDEILQCVKDIKRDKFLISEGYTVFRIWNKDVDSFLTESLKIEIKKPWKPKRISFIEKSKIRKEKFGAKYSSIQK